MKLDRSMSFRATELKRRYLALFLFGMVSAPAWSQTPTPPPDRPVLFDNHDGIVTSFINAPALFGQTSSESSNNLQWLKVELHYSVTTKPDQSKYLPAVTFKVWIEGRDLYDSRGKPDEGIAVALTGTVTYVNVPSGKDNYAVFYVHPDTLARYSTTTGYTDFDRKFNIHAEVSVDGQLSDYFDKNKEDDLSWYKPLTVIDGLVYRQNQCIFIVDTPSRYPAILSEGASSSSSSSSSPSAEPSPAPAPAPAPAPQ
jgi:hypothetical protein